MSILLTSATFVMRELVRGAVQAVAGDGTAQSVVSFLNQRFVDHSQQLTLALHKATDRAWRALEIALEGDSWWNRFKGRLQPGEERSFASQVQQYLQQVALHGCTVDREKCLAELRAMRQQKLLEQGTVTPHDLSQRADQFARFRDPAQQLDVERQAALDVARTLRGNNSPHLAAFLTIQAKEGEFLLAVAVRYFFRRAVEADDQLARGLAFARFEQLQQNQQAGFDALHETLNGLGERIEEQLGRILDGQAEQGAQLRDIYQAVQGLQRKLDLERPVVRPRDSLSIQVGPERELVKQLLARYRSLPSEQRKQMPELLDGLGKLQMAAGDFQGALQDFTAVASLVSDPVAQGQACFNAYRAALERRDWDAALRLLWRAVQLGAQRFAPFPMDRFQPQRILGAGGFGVAFLCQHAYMKAPVVVKTLADDDLERGIDAVFGEAQVLRQIDHAAIIRVQDCGFGGPDGKSRPYLVMDYFDGQSLEDVARERPLDDQDVIRIGLRMAEGLLAAHGKGILHRDVKPANVLARKSGEDWEVKLIDFGLAVRHQALAAAGSGTLVGASIAGTIDYAAPEQMGRRPGCAVSERSDVYGFGKTLCYALFGTPAPLRHHWDRTSRSIGAFLERCLHETPALRPTSMAEVLQELKRCRGKPRKKGHGAGRDSPASAAGSSTTTEAGKPRPRPANGQQPASPVADSRLTEADRLLAQLQTRIEAGALDQLGELLYRLRLEGAGEPFHSVATRTKALLGRVVRPGSPIFHANGGSSSSIIANPHLAAALSWSMRLTLWAL